MKNLLIILKSMVCAIFFINSSVAFGSDCQSSQSDTMYEALTDTMKATFSQINKEEIIVNNYEIVGAILAKEGEAVCQTTHLQDITPSFMKTNEGESQTGEGILPECNKEQRAELQVQAQYASLGSYGENKEALVLEATAVVTAVSCAAGAFFGVVDIVDDLTGKDTKGESVIGAAGKKGKAFFLLKYGVNNLQLHLLFSEGKAFFLLKDVDEEVEGFQIELFGSLQSAAMVGAVGAGPVGAGPVVSSFTPQNYYGAGPVGAGAATGALSAGATFYSDDEIINSGGNFILENTKIISRTAAVGAIGFAAGTLSGVGILCGNAVYLLKEGVKSIWPDMPDMKPNPRTVKVK